MTEMRVVVVGGGPTGAVAALLLAQRGIVVNLVEARPDFGTAGGSGLHLHGNALRVLRSVSGELLDAVLAQGSVSDSIVILRPDGEVLVEQPDLRSGGPDLPPTVGITRPSLQRVLADAVREAGVGLHLGLAAEAVEDGPEAARVRLADGTVLDADLVVLADGAYSRLRHVVDGGQPVPTGLAGWRALVPRPAAVTRTSMAYGGPAHMAGYAPMGKRHAYVMFAISAPGPGQEPRREEYLARVLELAAGYGGPVWEEIRGLLPDAEIHHTVLTAYQAQRWHKGRIVLAGDAAHSIPPSLAQGAAMGLEDALVLAELTARTTGPEELTAALAKYQARREPRVARVTAASMRLSELLATGQHQEGPAVIRKTLTSLIPEP